LNKFLWSIGFLILVIILGLFLQDRLLQLDQTNIKKNSLKILNFVKGSIVIKKVPIKKIETQSPQINARSVYLIDVDSAEPLFVKNETEKVPIASTTKIAAAMVILDDYCDHLSDIVTITKNMIDVEPSVVGLKIGEKITVENLLYGMLIKSGNDAAYSLAEYFGGKDAFVVKMNQKAVQIGLHDTHYVDPAGLNDEGYSTAKDLAIIGDYALRHSKFSEIVTNAQKDISSVDGQITHELKSTDRLIVPTEQYYYDKSIGGKTGFTNGAGYVLVSAAEDNGHRLLSVVLNTDQKALFASAKESKKLLEWGFDNYSW